VTTYYYDVVILGMEPGPLAAGAMLAKRGFRVLVLGGCDDKNRYSCFDYEFQKRPFMLTGADAPAIRRVIDDLGIQQTWQHLVRKPDPMWQVVLPNARIDIPRDIRRLPREVKREIKDRASGLDDAVEAVGRINGELGKLLFDDFVVPPESFFEKRELSRIEVQNPFRLPHGVPGTGRAAMIPEFLLLPLRMETGGAKDLHPIVHYRQLGGWLFDCIQLEGGLDAVRNLLFREILGQGGDVHPQLRIQEIEVKKGAVTGVRIHGREELTGCRVVLSHLPITTLAKLIKPSSYTKRFRALQAFEPPGPLGYSLNLGVDAEVIPAGLANTAFLANDTGVASAALALDDSSYFEDALLRIEQIPQADKTKAALHVHCIVPPEKAGDIASGALRDRILDRMRKLIPYLSNYLRVIHSPYDEFGPIHLKDEVGPIHLKEVEGDAPVLPHPEEVPVLPIHPPRKDGALGIGGLPYRSGIKGLILSGMQVVRGIGMEGEMLAAWGAARIVRKMDPRRERLVKSMRSKIEL
jgi:phytoene dehydrogenase-like protein